MKNCTHLCLIITHAQDKYQKMTKSIIITYNEADESFLMTLFKRFRIKIQETVSPIPDEDPAPEKQAFINDLKASILQVKAHQRGEIELPSFEESIKRIEKEIADEQLIGA